MSVIIFRAELKSQDGLFFSRYPDCIVCFAMKRKVIMFFGSHCHQCYVAFLAATAALSFIILAAVSVSNRKRHNVCILLCFICLPENDSFRKDLSFTRDVIYLLVRPKAIACGADLCFSPDVFFKIFFLSTRSPRCVGRPA